MKQKEELNELKDITKEEYDELQHMILAFLEMVTEAELITEDEGNGVIKKAQSFYHMRNFSNFQYLEKLAGLLKNLLFEKEAYEALESYVIINHELEELRTSINVKEKI